MKRKSLVLFFLIILLVLGVAGCGVFESDDPSAINDKGVMNLSSASTIGDNTFIELNALDGAIWENGNMIKIFRVIAAFKEAHPELEVAPLTTTDIIINTTKITNTKTEKIIKGIWLHHSPQR